MRHFLINRLTRRRSKNTKAYLLPEKCHDFEKFPDNQVNQLRNKKSCGSPVSQATTMKLPKNFKSMPSKKKYSGNLQNGRCMNSKRAIGEIFTRDEMMWGPLTISYKAKPQTNSSKINCFWKNILIVVGYYLWQALIKIFGADGAEENLICRHQSKEREMELAPKLIPKYKRYRQFVTLCLCILAVFHVLYCFAL